MMSWTVQATMPRRRSMALLGAALIAGGALLAPNLGSAQTLEAAATDGGEAYRIGFHFWKPGKIYDEAMAGITDGLDIEGIRYEPVILHSDRNPELAAENLRELDAMDLDVIYSLSSAGTKIAMKLNLQTPVVATVINHPASLGVSQDGTATGTRLTGTSYYVDAKKQMALYLSLFSEIAKVGMIYDVNNPAGALAEEPFMRQTCEAVNHPFASVGVREKGELEAATRQLIDQGASIIVIPTNRLVYANLDIVLQIANREKVPVVSMNKQGVENGALAALYADTYNLGRDTASMVRRIVSDDADPMSIDFQYIMEPEIILNLPAASSLGYEFPAEILSSAAIIID